MSFESVDYVSVWNNIVNGFKGADEALVIYKLVDSAKTSIMLFQDVINLTRPSYHTNRLLFTIVNKIGLWMVKLTN